MMCLLLEFEGFSSKQKMDTVGYAPIEEHHGAWIVKLIHLERCCGGVDTVSYTTSENANEIKHTPY